MGRGSLSRPVGARVREHRLVSLVVFKWLVVVVGVGGDEEEGEW